MGMGTQTGAKTGTIHAVVTGAGSGIVARRRSRLLADGLITSRQAGRRPEPLRATGRVRGRCHGACALVPPTC